MLSFESKVDSVALESLINKLCRTKKGSMHLSKDEVTILSNMLEVNQFFSGCRDNIFDRDSLETLLRRMEALKDMSKGVPDPIIIPAPLQLGLLDNHAVYDYWFARYVLGFSVLHDIRQQGACFQLSQSFESPRSSYVPEFLKGKILSINSKLPAGTHDTETTIVFKPSTDLVMAEKLVDSCPGIFNVVKQHNLYSNVGICTRYLGKAMTLGIADYISGGNRGGTYVIPRVLVTHPYIPHLW